MVAKTGRGTTPAPVHDPQRSRFFDLPCTSSGRWALGFLGGAILAFVVANLGVTFGQRGGDTIFDNLFLAFTMLAAGACVLVSGALAAFAIAVRRDRSALLFAAALLGVVVLVFLIGEVVVPH